MKNKIEHSRWNYILFDVGFFCTYHAVSAPQALYKLYNVAANHRHLYHHAFPGPQVDEDGEEQDKKRDWLDRDKNTAGTSWWWTGGGGRRRRGGGGGGTSSPIRHSLLFWCRRCPTSTVTTLKLITGLYNVHVSAPPQWMGVCFEAMDAMSHCLSLFFCLWKKKTTNKSNTCTDTVGALPEDTWANPTSSQLFCSISDGFFLTPSLWIRPHSWQLFCSLKFSAVYKKQYLRSAMFESQNMYCMLNNEALQASSAW